MKLSIPAAALMALAAASTAITSQLHHQAPIFADMQHTMEPDSDFTVFRHASFPAQQLRFKRNDGWCDSDKVKSWSGYLDSEDSHFFFYYFESRSKPAEDPVLLWINGGPGCSSSMGLMMELGPCQIKEEGPLNGTASTYINPHSWNNNANLLFLDQPVGVGFSYSDHHKHVGSTEKAAKDVQAFVTLFFETFSDLKGRPFHFAGESYGGRYIPLFAASIIDHNAKAIAGGMTPINFKGVLIGNGLTDEITTIPTYYTQACTNISGSPTGPVLDIHTCAQMQSFIPRCEAWLKEACTDSHDVISCRAAQDFCSEKFMGPYSAALWNPYNVAQACPTLHEDLCYSATTRIVNHLNDEKIRERLGVKDDAPPFISCSSDVSRRFNKHNDEIPAISTYLYVTALVERGVDVLIYNGKYDWICNWESNRIWLNNLIWSGSEEYLEKEMKPWRVSVNGTDVKAGDTKSATSLGGGKITFATVEKAGHMVPYDQPEVALEMVNKFLSGKSLN